MKRSAMPPRTAPMARNKPIRPKRKGKRRRSFAAPSRAAVEARNAMLRELGCICCRLDGWGFVAPEIHHPRSGTGAGQKASDLHGLPICPAHHRGTAHPSISSIHLDKLNFIARYGTEAELLARVNRMIGWDGE